MKASQIAMSIPVSNSFMFMGHPAWTMAVAPEPILEMITGKFISGIFAFAFAYLMCKIRKIDEEPLAEPKAAAGLAHTKNFYK